MFQRDALEAAREVDRPRHGVDLLRAARYPRDRRQFVGGEVSVPSELLQDRHGEFGIAVGDLRALRIGSLREEAYPVPLDAEPGAERAAAVHHMEIGVVEQRG